MTDVDAELPEPDEADIVPKRGLPWARVVALVVVMAFFGGSVGYVIGSERQPSTDSVDVGFYRDMIAHHEQAVEMSLIELRNGENSVVRGFAQEIIIFQRWEMGRMHEQLLVWRANTAPQDPVMGWMGMPLPLREMPGLASEEQMQALRDAKGAEADALFLELMSEHHRGGVHMASYAATHANDADVRALAATMARNQRIDIAEFRQTAERFGLDADIGADA